MINENKVKSISNITSEEQDSHAKRAVLNFSETDIPQEYYKILLKGLYYKIAKERLPLLDIIGDTTNNISAAYMPIVLENNV